MDSTVLNVLPRAMSILVLAAGMIAQAPNGRANTVAQIAPDVRQALAPGGTLRVGVYPGSPTSMIRDRASGETKGLAYELGQEFARRLNIPFEPVEFTQIADVLDALKRGAVDFTVTNASPARAKDVDFTAPILGVELGYLVPPRSSIATLADVDRPGVRVGVTAGGSSHATLQREFKHATVVPSPSVTAAVEMLADGRVDAYATNKAILFEMSDQSPGSRVLDGRWGIEVFAMGIPKGREVAMPAVRRFADEARSQGLVKRAVERARLRGTVNVE
jgi:polar amino acid transport system substrate-binding protein